ncbi:hypothetical protein C0585_01955 [Candidatus Woesearchaeota archaeon]|nr:MAG: hypothetical protein C0585_01955 [Candidatus Woesearchaeota archaeon]
MVKKEASKKAREFTLLTDILEESNMDVNDINLKILQKELKIISNNAEKIFKGITYLSGSDFPLSLRAGIFTYDIGTRIVFLEEGLNHINNYRSLVGEEPVSKSPSEEQEYPTKNYMSLK